MLIQREALYKEFAIIAEHPLDVGLDVEEMFRRFRFMNEEVSEVYEAISDLAKASMETPELVAHLLKELADVQYTLSGFAATFGLNLDAAYVRVHESNMSKFQPDGPTYSEDGKVQKGPNYKPPSLEDLVI
jgi:predicted HAD superfamily Cof-like phosphohydrolase|tara:strand:- start:1294 stop:1686 length:393 start_codon:yes stop_codon:yes gene_type:complete